MGTKVSAATIVLPAALASGDYVPVDDGVLKQKIDLSLLVPAQIDLSSAGATGEKLITIAPAFPAANAGSYQISVATAAGGTPDEAITIGYNKNGGGYVSAEPTMGLYQEINYLATARGAASQRTMEAYFSFAGASPSDNAPRPFFFAYEPGDTSKAGTGAPFTANAKGELLYSYLSTGFNRCGTVGGGGLTIATSLNESVGGGLSSTGWAFFDVDGCRLESLRSQADIQRLTGTVGTTSTMVMDVASGHNVQVGARVMIWKPNGLGSYTKAWNASAVVVGTVTARTATSLTTNIDNTSLGIVSGAAGTGYGWSLCWSDVAGYTPSFLQLCVGTGIPNASIPFQMEVVGSACFKGFLQVTTDQYAAANTTINSTSFIQSPISVLSTSAQGGQRRQIITAYNSSSVGWSMGYPDDVTDSLDDYTWAVGGAQSTDSNFTVAKSGIAVVCDTNKGYVGIGGVSNNFGKNWLRLAAGTSTVAPLQITSGTTKTTPLAGEVTYDGTTFKSCTTAGTWNDIASGPSITGAQTATFVATNKPGSGTAGPTGWLAYTAGATTYYIPLFGA